MRPTVSVVTVGRTGEVPPTVEVVIARAAVELVVPTGGQEELLDLVTEDLVVAVASVEGCTHVVVACAAHHEVVTFECQQSVTPVEPEEPVPYLGRHVVSPDDVVERRPDEPLRPDEGVEALSGVLRGRYGQIDRH